MPNQLAADLGVSQATVSRWLKGRDVPNTRSCRKLAEYSNVSLMNILSFTGHVPKVVQDGSAGWPEFREYIKKKYPDTLDENLIAIIEDYIERRRAKGYGRKYPKMGI